MGALLVNLGRESGSHDAPLCSQAATPARQAPQELPPHKETHPETAPHGDRVSYGAPLVSRETHVDAVSTCQRLGMTTTGLSSGEGMATTTGG